MFLGISHQASNDTLTALYEIKRSEVNRLEKELNEYKMQTSEEIDNLRKNLLISESEGQRTIMEYQQQCGNNIKFLLYFPRFNFFLKQYLEICMLK